MTNQITYLTNAFETTLTSEAGSTDGTINVTSASGLTAPCYLVVEPDSGTQREYMLVTNIASLVLTVTRYLAGSAAGSGLTHPNASVVRMAPVAQHVEDLNDRVDAVAATVVTDHGNLAGLADDDHSQYHNDARAVSWHSALSGSHVTNGDGHDHVGGDGAEIDHGNTLGLADDDHAQYHTDGRAVTWHDADDHSGLDDFLTFGETGVLTVKTGTMAWPVPYTMVIQSVEARVSVAPTGAALIVDVNRDGVSLWSDPNDRPSIAVSTEWGQSGIADVNPQVGLSNYLTVDIDQVGSTVAGSDLVVVVRYRRA